MRHTKLFRAQTPPPENHRMIAIGAVLCRADLAAAVLVALRLVSMRLLHALCFPSIVIGLTV